MADELKNVQRIDANDSSALESELQPRMIGTEKANRRIGSKSSDGTYTEYMSKNETDGLIDANSDAIEVINEQLIAQQNASMAISSEQVINAGAGEANRVTWPFIVTVPPSNTDVLDADPVANTVSYKIEGVRYTSNADLTIKKLSSADKILYINGYNVADDLPIGTVIEIPVDWGNGDSAKVNLTDLIEAPAGGISFYYQIWGTRSDGTTPDGGIEVTLATSTIESQGSGAGASKWVNDTYNGLKILRTLEVYESIVAGSASGYSGAMAKFISSTSATGGNLNVLGGVLDGEYVLEPTQDPAGNDVYKRTTPSVAYISKDSSPSQPYWCIDEVVNPVYFNADYFSTGTEPDGTYQNPVNPADSCEATLEGGATSTGIATDGDIVTDGNLVVNGQGISLAGGQAIIGYVQNAAGDKFLAMNVAENGGSDKVIFSIGSDLIPRFSIPASGAGLASQLYRSFVAGGYIVGSENSTDDTNSANLIFDTDFLDFSTGNVGEVAKPDFAVAGAGQIVDKLLIGASSTAGSRVVIEGGSSTVASADYSIQTTSSSIVSYNPDGNPLFALFNSDNDGGKTYARVQLDSPANYESNRSIIKNELGYLQITSNKKVVIDTPETSQTPEENYLAGENTLASNGNINLRIDIQPTLETDLNSSVYLVSGSKKTPPANTCTNNPTPNNTGNRFEMLTRAESSGYTYQELTVLNFWPNASNVAEKWFRSFNNGQVANAVWTKLVTGNDV